MSSINVIDKEKALPPSILSTINHSSYPSQVHHLKAGIVRKISKMGVFASRI
jgi:hypothetical protein